MKVAVGLSGGVDSALSAALLAGQGEAVTGVFLECWNEPGCRTDRDRQDALKVALKLKIPFQALDFKQEYSRRVMTWCYREFKAGRTPNPDIVCNREIKFGLFLEWAMKRGFDLVATGHYARLRLGTRNFRRAHTCREGREAVRAKICVPAPYLLRSVDEQKDQTYFLALLKAKQLRRVLFPIGFLTKKQVRQEAKKRGLPVWDKKDSAGICFIGQELKFRDFLKRKIKEHEGEAVDRAGKIVGKHRGVEFYTIGQRWHRPYFVIQKDIKSNRLIVGAKQDLARKEFEVASWNWISGRPNLQGESLKCRIRHRGELIPVRIGDKRVILKQAVLGVAPGQVAVIYSGQVCLGGGIIS